MSTFILWIDVLFWCEVYETMIGEYLWLSVRELAELQYNLSVHQSPATSKIIDILIQYHSKRRQKIMISCNGQLPLPLTVFTIRWGGETWISRLWNYFWAIWEGLRKIVHHSQRHSLSPIYLSYLLDVGYLFSFFLHFVCLQKNIIPRCMDLKFMHPLKNKL